MASVASGYSPRRAYLLYPPAISRFSALRLIMRPPSTTTERNTAPDASFKARLSVLLSFRSPRRMLTARPSPSEAL